MQATSATNTSKAETAAKVEGSEAFHAEDQISHHAVEGQRTHPSDGDAEQRGFEPVDSHKAEYVVRLRAQSLLGPQGVHG